MTKLRLLVLSWIGIGGLCLPVPLAAQAQSTSGRPASAKPAAKAAWTAPRTPWGDPDLQGNYTNVYENGTPFERPEQFAGRKLDEVKGEELARIKRATQERTTKQFQPGSAAPTTAG